MGQLNQIIIEGTIREPLDGKTGKFVVVNNKRYSTDSQGKICKEEDLYDVYAYGEQARQVERNYRVWGLNEVKITGRCVLKKFRDEDNKLHSEMRIVAEHIEFSGPKLMKEIEMNQEKKKSKKKSPAMEM